MKDPNDPIYATMIQCGEIDFGDKSYEIYVYRNESFGRVFHLIRPNEDIIIDLDSPRYKTIDELDKSYLEFFDIMLRFEYYCVKLYNHILMDWAILNIPDKELNEKYMSPLRFVPQPDYTKLGSEEV